MIKTKTPERIKTNVRTRKSKLSISRPENKRKSIQKVKAFIKDVNETNNKTITNNVTTPFLSTNMNRTLLNSKTNIANVTTPSMKKAYVINHKALHQSAKKLELVATTKMNVKPENRNVYNLKNKSIRTPASITIK